MQASVTVSMWNAALYAPLVSALLRAGTDVDDVKRILHPVLVDVVSLQQAIRIKFASQVSPSKTCECSGTDNRGNYAWTTSIGVGNMVQFRKMVMNSSANLCCIHTKCC